MSVLHVLFLIISVLLQTYAYNQKRFVLKYPSQYEEDDSDLRHALMRQYYSAQTKRSIPDKLDVKDSANKRLYHSKYVGNAPSNQYGLERNIMQGPESQTSNYLQSNEYAREKSYDYSDEQFVRGRPDVNSDDEQQQPVKDIPQYEFMRLNASEECKKLSPKNELITFADPSDPHYYFMCESPHLALRMPCPPFTLYSKLYNSCLNGNEDTSPCRGCLNGGDCVITERGYECHCGVNYEGKHCEKHIPRCDPNPCQNGGRCYEISTEPGYICECPNKIFDTCCCHGIENKCAHVPRRFYADKGRMFIHCSRDGYAFVKFCPLGLVFNDLRQTCTPRPQYHSEGFKSIQNEDFYKQTENEEYYDKARASDQQPPYIFNQSAPHAFY